MYGLYLTSVVLHILAAALWVGGMGFFALVVVPVARRGLDEAPRRELLRAAGVRFARIGNGVLGALVLTGIGNLAFRGLLPSLATAAFWSTPFGTVLAAKLVLVALVFAVSIAHSRDARRAPAANGPPPARASLLGRVTLLLSLAVIVLAVFLVRGAPW